MLIVQNIRLPLAHERGQAFALARHRLGLAKEAVGKEYVHRVSVDARRRQPTFVYSVALELLEAEQENAFTGTIDVRRVEEQADAAPRAAAKPGAPVLVCGFGPAGLFAALELAEAGLAPIVLEQGPAMDERRSAVRLFNQGAQLLPYANIQFGEGGAGTFSDGKLVSRIGSPLKTSILRRLVCAGAPEEILYQAKPHIGTDVLQGVFVALRRQLLSLGGQVLFNTRLTGLAISNGRLVGAETTAGHMPCSELVLAAGHSARQTFQMLMQAGIAMEAKPFSVGFRIEHLQRDIDEGLYHEAAGHPLLPPGEYQLAARVGGHGVYTFCMCPGGTVVCAASEAGGVVTNGMSMHARNGANANSAVVVGVGAMAPGPLAGVSFQRQLEESAFALGQGGYTAPAETLGSFLANRGRLETVRVQPTYPRGVNAARLGSAFPEELSAALRGGLRAFGQKLRPFSFADSVLTGLETRTSSPVRILRGPGLESPSAKGFWPCGEGAGYAGGIVSAAVDGMKTARAIIERYR